VAQRPDFHLLVVGGGASQAELEQRATTLPWLHVLGPRFGRDRAAALAAADVTLIPGAVGLGVIDSIVAGTPLITSADSAHGPEIAYLRDGENGRLVAGGGDPMRYAAKPCSTCWATRRCTAPRGRLRGRRGPVHDRRDDRPLRRRRPPGVAAPRR
jgi:hypothetical protein